MRKSFFWIGLAAVFLPVAAAGGPYTGQDIVDGVGLVVGVLIRLFSDMAQAAEQSRRNEAVAHLKIAQECAIHDMNVVLTGAKTDADVANLGHLIDDRSIAKRLWLKCNPHDDLINWQVETLHQLINCPSDVEQMDRRERRLYSRCYR